MADVTLKYKGATIGELSETGSKTLKTAGKYCEADILAEYVKPGGGSLWELVADYTSEANSQIVEADIPQGYQTANVYKVQITAEFTREEYPYFGMNGGNTSYEAAVKSNTQLSVVGYIVKVGRTGQNYAISISNTKYTAANNPSLAESVRIKSYYANAIKAGCNIKIWRLLE